MSAQPRYRIVHCFRSPVGGIFRHVRDLVDAQVAQGHSVGLVLDSSTGGEYEDALVDSITDRCALGVERVEMQRHVGLGDIGAAWRTFREIRKMKPDILHGHGAKGGAYARLFGTVLRVSGSRVARLYSPHGGSLHYDDEVLSGKFLFRIERLLERVTDHLLFVAAHERDAYRAKVGKPRCAASIVYNGVTAAEFEPVIPAADAADFIYIGMMRSLKGPDIFLESLDRASKILGRRLSAVMVGDGEDREKLAAIASAPSFSADVTVHRPMPARAAFRLARTIVVPSRAEAMPYIVLEALTAGMPIIATAVGGIPEVFGDARAGLVTPDPGIIARKMVEVLGDEDAFRAKMPVRETLQERFSAQAMARAIDRIYRTAMGDELQAHGFTRQPA